tara:strand:+ start:98 stop:334 length:237 start_codon:yes stop_codon:yes gene_type:complete
MRSRGYKNTNSSYLKSLAKIMISGVNRKKLESALSSYPKEVYLFPKILPKRIGYIKKFSLEENTIIFITVMPWIIASF